MKTIIRNMDDFVKVNNVKEIKNPLLFYRGFNYTEDGLLSKEIFGQPGTEERKTIYGYIDLKEHYLHPLVYNNLIRLNRKFEKIIAGVGFWTIKNDELIHSEEEIPGSGTGIPFIYEHWDSLKFKKTGSVAREERIEFIKGLNKKDAFMSKQIVIPAFYRDVDFNDLETGKIKPDAINDLYAKIIRLTSTLGNEVSGFEFIGHSTRYTIQRTMNEIYKYFVEKIKGKNGIFHQAVMGRSTDYSARSVISAPDFKANRYTEMKASFEYSGVPLVQVINLFSPFIVKYIQDYILHLFENQKYANYYHPEKKEYIKSKFVGLDDSFSSEKIRKKIKSFEKSPNSRFDYVKLSHEFGEMILDFIYQKDGIEFSRQMTWTDLFYMAAVDVTANKHVYITRYPLEDFLNIYPSKINVLSTFETEKLIVNEKEYKNYPIIDVDGTPLDKVGNLFVDVLQLGNVFLPALGGDFDGDQTTIRGVFTQEANQEAHELIRKMSNIVSIAGENRRKITIDAIQTIYNLTK